MDPLDSQLEVLRRRFPGAELERRGDGTALITIPGFPLPDGWNSRSTTVVFVAPVGFPIAKPDCFWASQELSLANNTPPANSGVNTSYGGVVPMRWFSYHANGWNPNLDTLFTYANVILGRLRQVR